MSTFRIPLIIGLLLVLSGCIVSEQIGEPVGRGRSRMPSKDVTMHFDTDFNKAMVYGRSAAIAGLALWILVAFRKNILAMLLAMALFSVAGWLVHRDYPTMNDYRIVVEESGLHLSIPPDLDTQIPWNAVESLELAGHAWGNVGGGFVMTPMGGMRRQAGVELPDWETMDITLAGGQTHRINLKRLSIEHRQIFAQALIKRSPTFYSPARSLALGSSRFTWR